MIVDRKNFPLIEAKLDFRTKPIGVIQITKTAMLKIVSSIPEDASIGVMRNALVDSYRASDTNVANLFNGFSGTDAYKYQETIKILNAVDPSRSDIPGFDHKAYQADYKAKFDILNAKLLYEIKFTDSTAVEFAKFVPTSFGVEFDRNLYTLQVSDTFRDVFVDALNNIRKNTTVLSVRKVVGNSYTTVGKFYYTNRFGLLRPDFTTTVNNFYGVNNLPNVINPSKNLLEGNVFTILDVDNVNR